ncbi:MAG: type II toxin-antitoxin system VapC family toxin [Anaerolineae bacterium]|nr:type II toxin-antitoxin system VapC family toxin [Anaerolineae bacterium]
MPVVDASVYVAYAYAKDIAHTQSQAWMTSAVATGQPLVAPTTFLAEVAGAISRNSGRPRLARSVVQQLLQAGLVSLMPVTEALAERAAEIAGDYKIKGADAVYVALAEHLGDELVTLDQEQLQRGGVVVTTRQP